jgi:hypothetical protein
MTRSTIALALTLITVGCGGGGSSGGGGGGGGSSTAIPFTSWSNVRPNTEIVAPAISTETTFTENLAGTITSVGNFKSYYGIEFREAFGADGKVVRASITTGDGDRITFNTADGAKFVPISNGYATLATNKDESAFGLVVEPGFQGWNYQTFGVWSKNPSQGQPGKVGSVSTGTFTPAGNIPSAGVANFVGTAAGNHVSVGGFESSLISSNMLMTVDFKNRTANFKTTDTLISRTGERWSTYSGLNMSGVMTVTAGQNQLSGSASTPGFGGSVGKLSGPIYGRFYGPSAQEVGGTFGLKGSGVETYIGGFGGKR